MLEIINTRGEVLELDSDVAIPVERNNTLFNDDDKIYQDIAYSASTSLTPSNKMFINGGHRIGSKTDVYTMPIQVNINNSALLSGVIDYSIKNNKIEFTLKPNFTAFAAKISSFYLNEIDPGDLLKDLTLPQLEALMLDTVQNPQNHNYIFAPLFNTRLGEGQANPLAKRDYINFWDYDAQKYTADAFAGGTFKRTINQPFYKLSYVLKIIANVLGYKKIDGNWINSPDANSIYIYSVIPIYNAIAPFDIYKMGYFLPELSISNFLKQVRERLHLSFDFNDKTFSIESFDTAIKKEVIDIATYLEAVTEIKNPDQKGYNVSLEVDEKDTNWNAGSVDNADFKPALSLLIGNYEKEKVLKIGTLKTHKDVNKISLASSVLEKDLDATQPNKFNLRLFKFNGLTLLEPNKYWPQSSGFDVSLNDAKIFQLLNFSKQIRVTANIPYGLLLKITSTSIVAFVNKEGEYVQGLVEKISYDLSVSKNYIKTDIICRNLNFTAKTQPTLRDNLAVFASENGLISFKSNRDGLRVEFVLKDSAGIDYIFKNEIIRLPCDKFGLGGKTYYADYADSVTILENTSLQQLKLKVFSAVSPIEVRSLSFRGIFTFNVAGYYECNLPLFLTYLNNPFFIVF